MTSIVYRPYPVIRTGTLLWIFIILSVIAHLIFISVGDETQTTVSQAPTQKMAPIQLTLTEPESPVPLVASSPILTPGLDQQLVSAPAAAVVKPVTPAPTVPGVAAVTTLQPTEVLSPNQSEAMQAQVADAPSGAEMAAAAMEWLKMQAMTQFEPPLAFLNGMLTEPASALENGLRQAYRNPDGWVQMAFNVGGTMVCAESRAANPLDSFDVGLWRVNMITRCAVQ